MAAAQANGRAVYDVVLKETNDPRQAQAAQADAIQQYLTKSGYWKPVVDAGMSLVDDVFSSLLSIITDFRSTMTETVNATTAETLNEFLGTSFDAGDVEGESDSATTLTKATTVGGLVLDQLEEGFAGGGAVTLASGAKAARTFAGYGVNFAIQNAI